jgi:putative DNA primase/helicase
VNFQQGTSLLNVALGYAKAGIAVFPLQVGGKMPLFPSVHPGSTPEALEARDRCKPPVCGQVGHGVWDATTDPATIAAWWRAEPNANIGIAAGLSGLLVVDIDTKDGKRGAQTLAALEGEHGRLPRTLTVRTWSGGLHYFFRMPSPSLRNTTGTDKAGLGPDIDTRGDGGYVVAAPSVIRSGDKEGAYSVLLDAAPVALPSWIVEKLTKPKRAFTPPGRRSTILPSGERVDTATGVVFPSAPTGPAPAELLDKLRKLAKEIEDLKVGDPATQPVNDRALWLGHYVPHLLTEDQVREALTRAIDTWDDGHEKGYRALETGLRDGMADPKEWEVRRSTPFGGGQKVHGPPGKSAGAPGHTWDDFGLADRLVDRHGMTIRWIADTEQWAAYEGGRWTFRSAPSTVWARCIETVRAMDAELEQYEQKDADGFVAFLRKSRSRLSVAAMREIAQGDPRIAAEMAVFDRQKHLLNIKNGVLDLEGGKLLPHDPGLYLMQQAGVKFDAEASAPRWTKFLERSMPDQARRDYLARIAGYTLTADTSEQCIFVHVGTGANGKSVYIEVLMALLGDYAQSVPSTTLLASKGEGVPNDVARMVGKRLLSTVETAAGKKLDEELVKQLTGGDTVSARFMRAEFFDFRPVGKIHLATNHLPHVGAGYGTARRLQDIGWDVTIPEEERDRSLAERIIAEELPGVLNWALKGYADWRLQGLSVPEAVRERTREHLESSDPIGLWLTECIEIHGDKERPNLVLEDAEVESSDLYANYRAWTEAMGMKPMTLMSLVSALKERGLRKGQNSRSRRGVFFGVRIAATRAGS